MLMTFKPAASAGLSRVPRFLSGITERNVKDLKCITVYLLWQVQTCCYDARESNSNTGLFFKEESCLLNKTQVFYSVVHKA